MKNNIAIKFIEDLIKSDPVRSSSIFENMDFKQAIRLFKKLSTENQAKCIKHFNPKFAAKILSRLSTDSSKEIISKLDRYKLVSIIRNSSDSEIKDIINFLDQDVKSSIYYLFDYPRNSAARIMYPDFISLKEGLKVKDAVNKLKVLSKLGEIKSYLYVVDDENNLCGVLNTRDLIISGDDLKIEEIMIKKIIKVSPYTHKNELIKIFSSKNFISLPVVDSSGKILGIVEAKDVVETAREETIEDMQLLLGSNPDEKIDSPFSFKFKHRLRWLIINLLTVFLSASVVAIFEKTIEQISIIAALIPVIIGQGAVAGTQTLSVIIRGIVMGEIEFKNVKKILISESFLGLANGFATGFLSGLVIFLWKSDLTLASIGFAALTFNTLIAAVCGAIVPIFMKKINFDPAHSSVVILTTITDIAGLFILLFLAKIFII